MPQSDQKAHAPSQTIIPQEKGSAVAPKISSSEQHVELAAILPDGPSSGEDIMQLARIGDVDAMRSLFEEGTFDARHSDGEGITPLHVGVAMQRSRFIY